MLGTASRDAEFCRENGFVGADYEVNEDLTNQLPEHLRDFSNKWIPYFQKTRTSKVSAGLAASQIWVLSKGVARGDIVLCPTKQPGEVIAGTIVSDYEYVPEGPLPHRRRVKWFPGTIRRGDMSSELRGGMGFAGTICTLDPYGEEILTLIGETQTVGLNQSVEDTTGFAMEKYLEQFLVDNWVQTELGKQYDIYTENGEIVGRQYQTDTGPIDILAVSKDKTRLLVVELKKGRASDNVVGQIQRYMGYALEVLAEPDQEVHGVIIALEDDLRIRRALTVTRNVEFLRYIVSFELRKIGA